LRNIFRMETFAGDYFLLTFLSCLGVLLFVTARGGYEGLSLMGRRTSQLTGLALVLAALAWFFDSKQRNVPDTLAGLNGNQQALLFAAGAVSALGLLLVLSSLRNRRMDSRRVVRSLDALRSTTYLRLITAEVRQRWDSWKQQTRKPFSG